MAKNKTEREIDEKPELWDYQDIPPEPSAAYVKQMRDAMPDHIKHLLAKARVAD